MGSTAMPERADNPRLALLLAMAMVVLVVATSLTRLRARRDFRRPRRPVDLVSDGPHARTGPLERRRGRGLRLMRAQERRNLCAVRWASTVPVRAPAMTSPG